MYRVIIKQLQLSFLSVLANISLSSRPRTPTSVLPFLSSLRPSCSHHLPLPVSRPPYFLSPRFSSFWTLSRCACGNFPGVIFAALLARSLTSLSSVFTPVVIFLSLHPLPSAASLLPSRAASSPYFPLSYSHPVSHFHDLVRRRPRSFTSFHVRVFPFHFRFLLSHITSSG